MASLIHPSPLRVQVSPSRFNSVSAQKFIFVRAIPEKRSRISLTVRARSAPTPPRPPLPETQQYILDIIDGDDVTSVPCVRTYENDLGRLTVVGAVDFEQALTAAAADGGEAANEHIAHGLDVMVAETVFPGHSDEHSTISTRLFLPARKVEERAKGLRSYLTEDVLSSTTSTNILAMTFRQVTLQRLLNFELILFRPGTTRNMKDLANVREVPASFTCSSADERAISGLAEVISVSALESTQREFLDNPLRRSPFNIFRLFNKPEKIISKDGSVILYEVLEDAVAENAKSLLQKFSSLKASYKLKETPLKLNWWPLPEFSKLEKTGGPEFCMWVSDYIPAYKLQIDSGKLPDLKLEGWKELAENRWEVILTHSQMVGLANVLDMYYEDVFTFPDKKLPYNAGAEAANMHIRKKSNSLLKMLSAVIVSGCFVVAMSVLGRLYLARFHNGRRYPGGNYPPRSLQTGSIRFWSMEPTMLEDVCVTIVQKIQAVYGWSGEIKKESGGGVSTGELPNYLRRLVQVDSNDNDVSPALTPTDKNEQEMLASTHKVASYQIVLSSEGKIVGFQPTSLLAVNNWASHPLTEELYGRKKLSPGFVEPSLKIKRPAEAVLLELVMSEISGSHFVLVRPVDVLHDS